MSKNFPDIDSSENLLLAPQTEQPSQIKGIIYANLYGFLQSLFQILLKIVFNQGMDLYTVSIVRFMIGVVLDFFVMKMFGQTMTTGLTTTRTKVLIICRCITFFAAFLFYFICIQLLPLTIFSLLLNLSGFWGMMIAYFALNDKMTLIEVFCVILGYIGVAMMIIGIKEEEEDSTSILGFVIALIAALCYGIVFAITKALKDVHFSVQNMYQDSFCLIVAMVALCINYFVSEDFLSLQGVDPYFLIFFLLVIAVVSSTLSMLFQTLALQLTKVGIAGAIFYIIVFYNFLGDIFIFDITFSGLQLLGGTIIIGVNLFLAQRKNKS